jgi:hypothetical protein
MSAREQYREIDKQVGLLIESGLKEAGPVLDSVR